MHLIHVVISVTGLRPANTHQASNGMTLAFYYPSYLESLFLEWICCPGYKKYGFFESGQK
jgi:hypothetical protein